MLEAVYTKRFAKDIKLVKKRGKNLEKLKIIVEILLTQSKLPQKYNDHWLTGNYANRRECHIESDWLLVYEPRPKEIVFERTGSHSDLFK